MYIYGKNVCYERLNSEARIHKAYVRKNFNDKKILELLKNKHIKTNFVDNIVLDNKVSGLHQGIILEIDEMPTYDLDYLLNINNDKSLVVMLDHLEDPHNFGAIIRTSEALGVDAIIIPNDRTVGITDTVVKTSTGAIERVPIIRVSSLNAALEKLKDNGYWIIGSDMNGTDYTSIDYNMKIVLIIGNEGKGMSKTLEKNCDYIATIPMIGKINSLNASVSCGILLSEIVRQRGNNGSK